MNMETLTKRDLIRQFIIDNDYYTIPSRQIAKMIITHYPKEFGEYNDKNIDNVRNHIRCLRDSSNHHTAKDKLFAERFHGFLEPDLNDFTPFKIPDNIGSIGILNDIHFPFQHQINLNATLDWLEEKGIEGILLNGDIIDCYKGSTFLKDRRKRSLIDEFNVLREFIDSLNARYNCQIFYKLGNHEERIENMVLKEVPELLEFIDFESCLRDGGKFDFNEYKLTVIKDKRIVKFTDNLNIFHGHEFRTGMFSPVGVARWLYNKTTANAMCGDRHTVDSYSDIGVDDRVYMTWAIGCLCDLHPKYMPFNKWKSGFAYIKRDGKNFKVTNLLMKEGEVY
jgi:hypothetical protein